MLTSSAKAKARRLQNQVARDLAKATGLSYGRPDDDRADFRGRQMGMIGPDIVRSLRAMEAAPFFVECKNAESWGFGPRTLDGARSPLVRWYIETATRALRERRGELNIPLVVATRNHYPVMAVVGAPWRVCETSRLLLPLPVNDGAYQDVCVVVWRDFLLAWYGKA